MPIKKTALKRLKADSKRTLKNKRIRSELKTLVKKLNNLISAKKLDEAKILFRTVSGKLQKAVTKNILKKNTASRKIGRIAKKIHRAEKPEPTRS